MAARDVAHSQESKKKTQQEVPPSKKLADHEATVRRKAADEEAARNRAEAVPEAARAAKAGALWCVGRGVFSPVGV